MDEELQRETEKLTASWMQYEAEMLRDYLIEGVEDPRLNVQSLLTRHFLIAALFGQRFGAFVEQEFRFATVMNWFQELRREDSAGSEFAAIQHALQQRADNAEGRPIPPFVQRAYQSLPAQVLGLTIPNYIENLLHSAMPDESSAAFEDALSTFETIWREILVPAGPAHASVLEVACGSANDYRFFERFGLKPHLTYCGIDLCEKNIANARAMFPQAEFRVGNAFEIDAADQAYDCCVVQDLFEHLSAPGIDRALTEVCRVTRYGLCLGFFNLYEGPEHIIKPVDDYHWNRLSVPLLRQGLQAHGFDPEVVHIDTFLRWRFGCDSTHNKNAYTIIAARA